MSTFFFPNFCANFTKIYCAMTATRIAAIAIPAIALTAITTVSAITTTI